MLRHTRVSGPLGLCRRGSRLVLRCAVTWLPVGKGLFSQCNSKGKGYTSYFFLLSLLSPLVSSSQHCSLCSTKYLLNEGPEIISRCLECVQRNVSPRRVDHEFVNLMRERDFCVCECVACSPEQMRVVEASLLVQKRTTRDILLGNTV